MLRHKQLSGSRRNEGPQIVCLDDKGCTKNEVNMSRKIFQRCDVLLILLPIFVSILLYMYFKPAGQVAQMEQLPADSTLEQHLPGPIDSVSVPKTGPPVRFLMLNAQNYFVEGDKPRSQYHRVIKSLSGREAVASVIASVQPDIVGLVEIGGAAALQDLVCRLASRGLHFPHTKVLERWGEDRALAVISRYPITSDHSVPNCLLEGQTARRMLRGILDVVVRIPDGRLFRIMGVHLKSKRTDDTTAADALRIREARTLATHVQSAIRSAPQMPILVYGDWNAGPGESTLAILTQGRTRESALRRLTPKDDRGETWTIYYKGGNEYNTFDQIYVNRVLSERMGRKAQMGIVGGQAAKKASDHRAVWCEIR